jgi:hypothetical protein
MKKNYLLFLLLSTLYYLGNAQTLTFTSDAGAVWDDGIATDGEGGSTNILGLVMDIYNVDATFSNISEMEWRSTLDLSGTDNFNGLTTFEPPYGSTAGWKGQIIKESSGLEFQMNAFDWFDWGNYDNQPMTVTGFRNGLQVATTSFTGNSNGNRVSVSLNSDFDNVDEVRILTTSGTTFPSINNIEISDATLSIDSNNLNNDFQIISRDNKFLSSKHNVSFEVYNLLGRKLKNDNLSSGIYIVKAKMGDKTIVVKRYL